ncbi:putative tail tubular protein A [Erwinia phage pEp_SNUABM_10]|uniref:Putative tail tubular protein A n=1 Tax=Erwinia phage pEp_SNUABM_09 TaxID=2601644 RepID=A0A5J6DA32_9CAUD|nr:putative tail tubular protein A [Erwinia phage pEp_SNUABM_09]QOC57616.1 putative tail tubular protein A [Erwinia phage pEp_SNUABM_03]QOC57671.1 putative tail tubular protein A [Erwinia phage pEp_SNUABM_04]QOC57721.1 putative tail tubular protein A [Erwinia phage pEp_SNUABM_10]QOC57774.1 putative tail tubular protein A [Erwinia phage pEp_SNUABM_11]
MRSYETVLETAAELSAVNDILLAIGEPPVSTLEGDSNADVASARRILNQINRQIQSRGWTFNIEEGRELVPDVFSGLIEYSSDYLSLMSSGSATVYINRGGYVYDRTTGTDQFSGPIVVNLIALRDFDEMPECYRNLIVAKAARKFNMSLFGAPEIDAVLAEEEREAKIACNEYELDYGNYNMLEGDAFVQGQLSR